jgi:DNA-binding SARP family transcriptional activator/Tfp pilus assembly protein PilF
MPYQKATALLAYLVVTASPQSRESLATLLWGDVDDQRARNSLRNALYVIGRELEPASPLVASQRQVRIDGDETWLDIKAFKRPIQGRDTDAAAASPLAEALALWRGPFLDGLSVRGAPDFDDWISRMREQLDRHHRQGWLMLSRVHERTGNWQEALGAARRALALDPLFEASHRQVMHIHLRMGNRVSAVRQYERCREVLLDELGVTPNARTQSLYEQALSEGSVSSLESETAAPASGQRVFVGRGREMAALREHQAAVRRESRGRLVLVEGEAGVGKTRLVTEWLATLSNAHVLTGHCFEAERSIPYHPWIDLLRSSLSRLDWERIELPNLWMSELSRLIPELRTVYPGLSAPTSVDSELARGRLAEAAHQCLRALARHQPVTIFLDDLQWIDRASLALLEYLLRHSRDMPLLVVGAQRERELDPAWQRSLSVLARAGLSHRITLYRLSFPEVRAIARDIGFRATDPDTFLQRLFRETEGNPLFVVEILRSLQETNVDVSDEWPIPLTVKDVVQAHLDRLDMRNRQLFTAAAVIGRTFDHTTLQAVTGQPPQLILSALDAGIAAGLIVEHDGRYDFSHNKIRAVLYRRSSGARRRHLHRRVAEALERRHAADLSPHFGLLANHFEAAAESDRACHYALRAAKRAVELYADEDALSWYERAQTLAETAQAELGPEAIPHVIPFRQRYVSSSLPLDVLGLVYRQQGLIHQRRGRYDLAQEYLQLALTRGIERQRADEQAAAHGLLSYLAYLRGDYDELAERAHASLDLASDVGEAGLRAEGLRNLGIAAYRAGDYERAIELYEMSLSASRSIGDQASVAKCYNNIGFALRTMERYEEAVDAFQQALELHRAAGSIEGAAGVLANIGGVYLRADASAELGTGSAAGLGEGASAELETNLDRALAHLERALALSDESHADWITAKVLRTMGSVYLRQRAWNKASASARRARDLAETLGNKEDLGAAYRLLGEVAAAAPGQELGNAEAYFERSLALLRDVGEQYELARTQASLDAYRRKRL